MGTKNDLTGNLKIVLPDETIVPARVISAFFDSEINAMTATVAAYVDVENKNSLLLPGNHVDVIVHTEKEKPLVLIPQAAAVQDGQGMFVYIVNEEEKAQKQYIKTGPLIADSLVVSGGLKAGDRIIVQGLQKVENGSPVRQSFAGSEV